jgi:hypothetical protein
MVCIREIQAGDVEDVVGLLTRGFDRSQDYWQRSLMRLRDHPAPPDLPKYGYVIDNGDRLVGVVLLISSAFVEDGVRHRRCNVSSWYVEPAFRIYSSLLSMRATRGDNITFFNVSPAPHTWTILEMQGFERFVTGRTIAVPMFSRVLPGAHVAITRSDNRLSQKLAPHEVGFLQHHEQYGCFSLICEFEGRHYPFVFGRQMRQRLVPVAHLVYCREFGNFVRFAGSIGRFLAKRGFAFVIFDSSGPTEGLLGKHFGGRPRYRKGGGVQVRQGDVAYSEQVIFGY